MPEIDPNEIVRETGPRPGEGNEAQDQFYQILYRNGRKITLKWDPKGEKWAPHQTDLDKDQQAIYKQEVADAKEAGRKETIEDKAPDTITAPDGSKWWFNRQTKNFEPIPGMPTKPDKAPEPPRVVPGATPGEKKIPVMQSDGSIKWVDNENYDAGKAAYDEKKRVLDLANDQMRQAMTQIEKDLAERRISIEEAKQRAGQIKDRLEMWVTQKNLELQTRQQEIQLRGQDINRETSLRGQDVNFASDIARAGLQGYGQALPYLAPTGTTGAMMEAIRGLGSAKPFTGNLPEGKFPYDPGQVALRLAAQALAQISPAAAQMVGAQPPNGNFQVPPVNLQPPDWATQYYSTAPSEVPPMAAPGAPASFQPPAPYQAQFTAPTATRPAMDPGEAGPFSTMWGAGW